MILTESEARSKWCPEVRCVGGSDETAPRPPAANCHLNVGAGGMGLNRLPEYARCIASECMAWRWIDREGWRRPDRGYCGLAGNET